MSLISIENEIVRELKTILNNPKVTKKHLQEWSTYKPQVEKNLIPDKEIYVFAYGVHCAVDKAADKRAK